MARKFIALLVGAFVISLVTPATGLAAQTSPNAQPAAAPEVAPPPALDFTGTWLGTIAIPEKGKRGKPSELRVMLKHDGKLLTGTIGPTPTGPVAISNGRVQATQYGTALYFDLKAPQFTMQFQLRPDDGPILRGLARLDGIDGTAPVELRLVDAAPRTASPSAVTGTWVGTFKLATTELLAHMIFDQSGATLTGTAGPNAYRQIAITGGKVQATEAGTAVTFQMPLTSENVVLTFDLKMTQAGLEGTVTAVNEGQKVVGPVQLKPVK